MAAHFVVEIVLLFSWLQVIFCVEKALPYQSVVTGPRGPPGPVGQRGLPGPPGRMRGLPGPPGRMGDPGLGGPQGLRGRVGQPGQKGSIGLPGEKGVSGVKGKAGRKGEKGDIGLRGAVGLKGERGDVGQKGEKGVAGEVGRKGYQGIRGPVGPIGLRGFRGYKGEKGIPGLTPFSEIKRLESLVTRLYNELKVPRVSVGDEAGTCNMSTLGYLFYHNTNKSLLFCDSEHWVKIISLISWKSYESCSAVEYKINSIQFMQKVNSRSPVKVLKVYCDYSVISSGCALVWKHSYFQVGNPTDDMRTFSSVDRPCTDLSDGWCNVGNKDNVRGNVQLTVAYHEGEVVYAYRGDRNSELGKSWRGAILNNSVKISDHCTYHNGVPPEPSIAYTPGLTFDKNKPGVYTGNCDTDRYKSMIDCRWENCHLPSSISSKTHHVQMTVAIFLC
ncbi:collagen alpha-1(XXIV) chain-like [Corticium candelabrum]|uniref:collagen alpha-1(XXIV) chain-like n=1 Tax=Corticium candelabrum TaxID=121492 RepID=UPI002E2677FF|nr:collagen alpha-1(XXIV) chain-like [Corticium candelabrum]